MSSGGKESVIPTALVQSWNQNTSLNAVATQQASGEKTHRIS